MSGYGKRKCRQLTGRPRCSKTVVISGLERTSQKKPQTRLERRRQIAEEKVALAKSEERGVPVVSESIICGARGDCQVPQAVLDENKQETQKSEDQGELCSSEGNIFQEESRHNKPTKPWETLVIGANLGDNLSRLEHKNRQILQQGFIIEWSKQNEPESVGFRRQLMSKMLKERKKMEQDDLNHLSADELRSRTAVAERIAILRSALRQSDFKLQRANMEAAIEAYQTCLIGYSKNFTIYYAGRIVDTCPSYQSSAVDRTERLNRYFDKYGDGWLWYEPPLAGPDSKAYAKKGFALDQDSWTLDPRRGLHGQGFGLFPINMRFVVDENKVRRRATATRVSHRTLATSKDGDHQNFPLRSAIIKCLLDCGATFPMLGKSDFVNLGIKRFGRNYAPQTVYAIETASSVEHCPLYDLEVEVGAALNENQVHNPENQTRPSSFDRQVKWHPSSRPLDTLPDRGILGGLCPVVVIDKGEKELGWHDRLSGIFPFKVCYISSVPTAGKVWLGENRRDVLGARRFPPYKRHVTDAVWDIEKPKDLANYIGTVAGLNTPQEVIFAHRVCRTDDPTMLEDFVDMDVESRNMTTYGIAKAIADPQQGKYLLDETVEFGPAV